MEVLNGQVTLLTNFEVLQLLNAIKKEEDEKSKGDKSKHLSTLIYETTKYLKTTPAAVQNTEAIEKLIEEVSLYKLTAAETLQLINLRPSTTAEVQLIVEESEERMKTEEKLQSLVNTVTRCLPGLLVSNAPQ
uniref:DNA-directed RNA polymerase III subunit RPC9 n=1 Tax=Angiostrongylus cantonensis TaxID=6313 RepID=A0A0K0CW56_ANGCA